MILIFLRFGCPQFPVRTSASTIVQMVFYHLRLQVWAPVGAQRDSQLFSIKTIENSIAIMGQSYKASKSQVYNLLSQTINGII